MFPCCFPRCCRRSHRQTGESYIDATFGAGGYSQAILAAAPGARVLGIDRDPAAIAAGPRSFERHQGRLTLVEGRFGDLDRLAREAGFAPADGVVLDIGVSSMQLDDPARGFSFQADGPLDMRMSATGRTPVRAPPTSSTRPKRRSSPTSSSIWARSAAHAPSPAPSLRNAGSSRSLARWSWPAWSRAFWGARRSPAGTRRRAPSRRCASTSTTSWASWQRGLSAAERVLAPGGRLVVVTFHSLEDRLVKQFLKQRTEAEPHGSRHLPPQAGARPPPSFRFVNHRPLSPTDKEIAANPRARSAKLRWAVRTDAPAWAADAGDLAIPRLGA